ncbi:MAG: hypothetical protein AB7R89_13300 [Dehalococcoidia bacterium]
MWKRMLLVVAIAIGLLPSAVFAQENGENPRDVLIRVNGPVQIAAGEAAQGIVVISDNAVIDGTVEFLVVIDGDATITGTVEESVIMVNGTVTLMDGARVGEDVLLYNADAVEEAGAAVAGGIHDEWGGFNISRGIWFGFWASMTVAVVAAGLLFAAVGGRQLLGAATGFTGHLGPTLLTALVLWVGMPVLAVFLMATVIGIPLGFGIVLFFLPALWFIGYLVAGAAVGMLLVKTRGGLNDHPYLAVLVGVLIFQVIALVPFVGGTVAFVAGLIGAGALAYRAWTAFRGRTPQAIVAPPAPTAPTA